MKKIVTLIVLLFPMMSLWAQNEAMNPKGRITEVKQADEEFIYADQTCATVDQALKRANELLIKELQEYFRQAGMDFETAKDKLADNVVTITMQRGDQFRAFVYIEKSLLDEKDEFQAIQKENVVALVPQPSVAIFSPLATMTTRLQVYDYVNQLQAEGNPVVFVNQPKADELDTMYLVLYRRGGAVEAILTPVDIEGTRHNLASGEPDDLANHPNTSINGIKIEQ